MKKLFYSVSISILIFIFLKFFSFNTQVYDNGKFQLNIPFYSKIYNISESNDEHMLTFKTLLTKSVLLNKTNKMLNQFEEYTCQNKLYYYDKNNNITIKKLEIDNNIFINQFSFVISIGKLSNNYCSKVVDYTNIKHQIKEILINPHEFKYKNTIDGNIYNVYFNLVNKDILLNTGMGKMNYLRDMIRYGWVSMNQFIDYLEYLVIKKDASKTQNNDYVIYKTKDFSLVKCNNNNIHIYDSGYDYSNFTCN